MRFSTNMKSYMKWGLMMLLPLYLIDQITKWIILTKMQIGESISVIPNYFEIVHVRNSGVAFGLLQNIPDSYRLVFFLTVTIIAIAAIFVIFFYFLCIIMCHVINLIYSEFFINIFSLSRNIACTLLSCGISGLK